MANGKRGAPMGNKNAAGGGGIRYAAVGALVPFGGAVTGLIGGASGKNERFASRHRKTNTVLGATSGAVAGTFIAPVIGTAIGGAIGAASGNIGSRLGYAVGKSMHNPTPAHSHLKPRGKK